MRGEEEGGGGLAELKELKQELFLSKLTCSRLLWSALNHGGLFISL